MFSSYNSRVLKWNFLWILVTFLVTIPQLPFIFMARPPLPGSKPPHYPGFTITHTTHTHTTVGRTPLYEWSARCIDLYLATRDTHNRQTSMPPDGILTHDLSRRGTTGPRLRTRGLWDHYRLLLHTVSSIYSFHLFRSSSLFFCVMCFFLFKTLRGNAKRECLIRRISPSVRMRHLVFRRTDFHEICVFFWKFCRENSSFIKIGDK